jgi:hypothetical protein
LIKPNTIVFALFVFTATSCQNPSPHPLSNTGDVVARSQPACQKADFIWDNKIVPSLYGTELPAFTAPGIWDALRLAMPSFTVKSLTTEGDELEQGRRKLVHAFGVEARLRFVANRAVAGGYTGIFQSGAECMIGRFSVATKPTDTRFVPGLALKFFIDGNHPSVNLHIMNSIDGQDGNNFFEKTFSNIIPPPASLATRLVAGFFERAAIRFGAKDSDPGHLTVEHLASIKTDGSKVAVPRAPYQLLFKPRPTASARFKGSTMNDDFRIKLADFPVGEALYDVYALENSETAEQGKLLGQLILNSKIVASRYGDEQLYFQHNMER